MIKNWKTTAVGIIGAISLTLQDLLSTGDVDGKTLIMAAISAAIGFLAKDFNVSGKK